jgi:hypothetical protein
MPISQTNKEKLNGYKLLRENQTTRELLSCMPTRSHSCRNHSCPVLWYHLPPEEYDPINSWVYQRARHPSKTRPLLSVECICDERQVLTYQIDQTTKQPDAFNPLTLFLHLPQVEQWEIFLVRPESTNYRFVIAYCEYHPATKPVKWHNQHIHWPEGTIFAKSITPLSIEQRR